MYEVKVFVPKKSGGERLKKIISPKEIIKQHWENFSQYHKRVTNPIHQQRARKKAQLKKTKRSAS